MRGAPLPRGAAGEKLFIDYSGKRPTIWNRETGEAEEVELYVAVLGASNYTYVEATRTQQLADFVMSTIRALEYFGVVPEILVPDQLRSAVSGPDRHDPEINTRPFVKLEGCRRSVFEALERPAMRPLPATR